MADVVDLIKTAHRQIEALLEQAESSDPEQVQEVLEQVAEALRPHSEAEESFVYPAIRDHDDREGQAVADGVAEHHHLDELLTRLRREDPSGPGFDGRLAAMIGELRHHVEEEEQDLLPVLSEKADGEEREELGVRFAEVTGIPPAGGPRGAPRRGRSTQGGPDDGPTRKELYERAKEKQISGRSTMSKEELAAPVEKN
jgi:hemerythrin superfamily protein